MGCHITERNILHHALDAKQHAEANVCRPMMCETAKRSYQHDAVEINHVCCDVEKAHNSMMLLRTTVSAHHSTHMRGRNQPKGSARNEQQQQLCMHITAHLYGAGVTQKAASGMNNSSDSPCADVALADAGALSMDESSRPARLLAEPFRDDGLLLALPLVATASLSASLTAAVTAAGSAALPFRPDRYAAVSNLATSFSSCCLYIWAALDVYCRCQHMKLIEGDRLHGAE